MFLKGIRSLKIKQGRKLEKRGKLRRNLKRTAGPVFQVRIIENGFRLLNKYIFDDQVMRSVVGVVICC